MTDRPFQVLFLCTGNSARSILSEAILNEKGRGRFVAHSAGSHPSGRVNPFALDLLRRMGWRTDGLRSKSWDEFAAPGAPHLDFVFDESIAGAVKMQDTLSELRKEREERTGVAEPPMTVEPAPRKKPDGPQSPS